MIKNLKFKFTSEDFKSGQYEDDFTSLIQGVNIYSDSSSEFTAVNPPSGWYNEYRKIATGFAQMPYIISSWQSNVGANDSTVVIEINEKNSPSVQARKKAIQKKVYSLIYTKHRWKKKELEIVKLLAVEGNAFVMMNRDGEIIIESISRFNVYWDNRNKIARYAYKVDGVEVEGMKRMRHGIDLWHIKDPVGIDLAFAPSRLQSAMAMILLENKATRLNAHMFANGWLSNIFLKFYKEGTSEIMEKLEDTTKDKENKTYLQRFMDMFNSRNQGVKNAGKVGIVPYLEDIIKVGTSNKDSQYLEMMKTLTPERVAWAYSMTFSNFGSGTNLTENNASTFDDALFDKLGRPVQQLLDECRNEFVLKLEGIITSENFYIKYNEPEDPKKLLETKEWREDLKFDALTINEYREKRGLPPIDNGDVTYSRWLNSGQVPSTITVDANQSKEVKNSLDFFGYATEKVAKKLTPTEKALKTKQYEKFEGRWTNAITKQIKSFLDDFSGLKDTDLETFEPKLPKIESFYAFNVLKDDLLKFAGVGMDEIKKDKRIKFSLQFFDGEYPKSVLEAIDERTEMLLKGLGNYKGVDDETTAIINNIIKENASFGVQAIAKLISEKVAEISIVRASIIAQTEVANAVEGTRYTMYKENFPDGTKEWQTAQDEKVRPSHVANSEEGRIPIDQAFSNGSMRAGDEPRCRCTTLYYPD
jgi:hypothetical protein